MRLGIEAKWFFEGPPGGQTYARNFTEALLRQAPNTPFDIFLRQSDQQHGYCWPDNATPRPVIRGNSYVMNRWRLGQKTHTGNVDWTLSHNFSPIRGSFRKALIVHDLLFLSHPEAFTWKERLMFSRIRTSVRTADVILAVSNFTAEDLRRREFVSANQPVLVCPCAASSHYHPQPLEEVTRVRNKHNLKKEYIFYLGRLNARKNIDRLIDAFASADIDNRVQLVLAGKRDGKMFDIVHYLQDRNLEDRVRLLGFVDLEDLPALYSGARFFAYVPFAEGFGIPPLEAMSCGTPVLSSNTTALPEVVQNSGYLIDPYQTSKIRAGIERLLNDTEFANRLKSHTLLDAKTYSWDDSANRWLDFLREVA